MNRKNPCSYVSGNSSGLQLHLGCNGCVPWKMKKKNPSKIEIICQEIETWVKKKKKKADRFLPSLSPWFHSLWSSSCISSSNFELYPSILPSYLSWSVLLVKLVWVGALSLPTELVLAYTYSYTKCKNYLFNVMIWYQNPTET